MATKSAMIDETPDGSSRAWIARAADLGAEARLIDPGAVPTVPGLLDAVLSASKVPA
jgi:hypothetical protein